MKNLTGSKTHENLRLRSPASPRRIAVISTSRTRRTSKVKRRRRTVRSTAEGETGHAHGHLDYLATRSATRPPDYRSAPAPNLKAAVAGETHEYTDMYPAWRRRRAKKDRGKSADCRNAGESRAVPRGTRFQKALDSLAD